MKPTTKRVIVCNLCDKPQESKFALKKHKRLVHCTGEFTFTPLDLRRHQPYEQEEY
jgi:hypothetical protein